MWCGKSVSPRAWSLSSYQREDLGRFYSEQDRVEASPETPAPDAPTGPPSKLEVYEHYLQVPHYIVYSRYSQRLRYFQWVNGSYEERSLRAENPVIWLEDLAVGLGLWSGAFEGMPGSWLRWCDRAGNWLLTDTEKAEQQAQAERAGRQQAQQQAKTERLARQQAQQQAEAERLVREQAQQQAEQERLAREQAQQQAARLAARLRELGINPDDV